MINTNFNQDENETQTKAINEFIPLSHIADTINNTNIHRLVFSVIVIGYIVIAFNGHMEDWDSLYRYAFFVLFSLSICFIILFIRKNRLSIENNIIKIYKYIIKMIKSKFKNFVIILIISLFLILLTQILKVL